MKCYHQSKLRGYGVWQYQFHQFGFYLRATKIFNSNVCSVTTSLRYVVMVLYSKISSIGFDFSTGGVHKRPHVVSTAGGVRRASRTSSGGRRRRSGSNSSRSSRKSSSSSTSNSIKSSPGTQPRRIGSQESLDAFGSRPFNPADSGKPKQAQRSHSFEDNFASLGHDPFGAAPFQPPDTRPKRAGAQKQRVLPATPNVQPFEGMPRQTVTTPP